MSHTPGPWHLEEDPTALHVYSEGEEVLHFTDAGWDDIQRGQYRANARLIAAAPELLEALERMTEAGDHFARAESVGRSECSAPPVDQCYDHGHGDTESCQTFYALSKEVEQRRFAAIAKARGA